LALKGVHMEVEICDDGILHEEDGMDVDDVIWDDDEEQPEEVTTTGRRARDDGTGLIIPLSGPENVDPVRVKHALGLGAGGLLEFVPGERPVALYPGHVITNETRDMIAAMAAHTARVHGQPIPAEDRGDTGGLTVSKERLRAAVSPMFEVDLALLGRKLSAAARPEDVALVALHPFVSNKVRCLHMMPLAAPDSDAARDLAGMDKAMEDAEPAYLASAQGRAEMAAAWARHVPPIVLRRFLLYESLEVRVQPTAWAPRVLALVHEARRAAGDRAQVARLVAWLVGMTAFDDLTKARVCASPTHTPRRCPL